MTCCEMVVDIHILIMVDTFVVWWSVKMDGIFLFLRRETGSLILPMMGGGGGG